VEQPVVHGTMEVIVDSATSSTISLSWDAVDGATDIYVYFGPEPSEEEGGELPLQVLDATLSGDATGHTIDRLAAATDVFVHVVAAGAPDGDLWGNTWARTPGGPRVELDTALREVHGYGLQALMLVLSDPENELSGGVLLGNDGDAWQGGDWTVTRSDGSDVAVSAVHRHSIPVGSPEYFVGYEVWPDNDIVDVDHRIFLELAEGLGGNDVLTVTHSGTDETALDVRVCFSDHYLETPLIQVNQVGYNPRASLKYAYVSGWMGDGGAADLTGIETVDVLVERLDPLDWRIAEAAGLAATVRSASDSDAGGEVREIDLSGLRAAEGVRYRVRIPGVGVSWPTAVSEEAAFKAFYTVWRGLFLNRWCGDLDADYTDWSRPEDHCIAYWVETGSSDPWDMFDPGTSIADPRPLRGGHHDAGDFDIRQFHAVVAQYLMRAYEMNPDLFTDGQLTIPESGNGIPDILDEALWNVAGWEQLQNENGSIRGGVESWAHPRGYYYANDDELPYWTYDPVHWHTAHVAGTLAQAAYLVEPFDGIRAAELEQAARDAYGWADSAGAEDEYLLYGASELYRLTGEEQFATDFETYWAAIDVWGRGAFDNIVPMINVYPGMWLGYHPAMADFVMGYYNAASPDAGIQATTVANLDERAGNQVEDILNSVHAHRHGRDGLDPDWGVATATGLHADMIYQRLQIGGLTGVQAQTYFNAMSLLADYVLGCNPMSYTYITGLGSRRPEEPVHTDSLSFIKDAGMPPMPGIPVIGMVRNMPGAPYYDAPEAAFYPVFGGQPLGWRHADTRVMINMSEFTVWENQAPLAELFAALLAEGMMPPDSWLPGAGEHRSTLPSHSAE
ncbi:MAG: glycoside hydrolase family 9 protein, partial [Pseudomonadota bacterium]